MNAWIHTWNGHAVDIRAITPEQVRAVGLWGIAVALAHVNRFTGHAGSYSDAQHSSNVARWLRDVAGRPDLVPAGLFHDGEEWVTGDMSTPMQHALAEEMNSQANLAGMTAGRDVPGFSVDAGECFRRARRMISRRIRAACAVAFGFEMPVMGHAHFVGEHPNEADALLVKRADCVMLRTEKDARLQPITGPDQAERDAAWLHGVQNEEPWPGADVSKRAPFSAASEWYQLCREAGLR